jgi:ankyrin repeat protein
MTTKKEMVRINDAAQALLQSKIDPLDTTTIDDSLPSSSSTTEKQHQTPVAVVAKVVAAVKEGDLDQLRFHAKHVEDFTQLRDSEGMPLLHVATSVDNVEVMDLLVVLGCDLNGLDERGGTAVLEAASVGSLRAMKWLVKAGITGGATRPDARGDTTLHLASGKGRVHMMNWLLEQGCDLEAKTVDFKARPLQYAITYKNEDAVRWLLKNGAEVRARDNAYGWNALHIAAANGADVMCMLLIKHAPDLLTSRSDDVTKLQLMPESIAYRNKFTLLATRLKKLRIAYEKNGVGEQEAKAQRIAAEVAARRLLNALDQEKEKETNLVGCFGRKRWVFRHGSPNGNARTSPTCD